MIKNPENRQKPAAAPAVVISARLGPIPVILRRAFRSLQRKNIVELLNLRYEAFARSAFSRLVRGIWLIAETRAAAVAEVATARSNFSEP